MKDVVQFGKKKKLSPRYIGPYKIIMRVHKVAYEVELSMEMNMIHLVFHVFILRKFLGDPNFIIPLENTSDEVNL